MKTIRITYDNGQNIVTDINGTKERICAYYIGKRFNIGNGENDLIATATAVEFLSED